jgi:uncharacterized PurR-regulated membrane protein YhhQ (DUF165 family)
MRKTHGARNVFAVGRWIPAGIYIASIWLANYFIMNVGTQYSPGGPHVIPVGFGFEAPSGVLWVGVALVARDYVQRNLGKRVAIGAMLTGAALSFLVAPALALASGLAFLLSEFADFAVYTPMSRRGHPASAVLASGTVGSVVDTVVFLSVAFGSLAFWQGQLIGKLEVTVVAAAVIWIVNRRSREAPRPAQATA